MPAQKPVRQFEIDDNFAMTRLSELKNMEQTVYIYIIEQIGGDIEDTHRKFKKFKEDNADVNCSKLNLAPSRVMYVGSSITNLHIRIRQHTEKTKRNTNGKIIGNSYALRLNDWFKGRYKITVLEYYTTPREIQKIENKMWEDLKPAFGKKGGNNK